MFDLVFYKVYVLALFCCRVPLSVIHRNLMKEEVKILGRDRGEIMKSVFHLVGNIHG